MVPTRALPWTHKKGAQYPPPPPHHNPPATIGLPKKSLDTLQLFLQIIKLLLNKQRNEAENYQ